MLTLTGPRGTRTLRSCPTVLSLKKLAVELGLKRATVYLTVRSFFHKPIAPDGLRKYRAVIGA